MDPQAPGKVFLLKLLGALLFLSLTACSAMTTSTPAPTTTAEPGSTSTSPVTATVRATHTIAPTPTKIATATAYIPPGWALAHVLKDPNQADRSSPITCISWSPYSTLLASGWSSGQAILWDASTGTSLWTMDHPRQVTSCAFSPSGERLATGSGIFDRRIRIWDVASGELVLTIVGHLGEIHEIAWSPDGKSIAGAGRVERSARLWDADTGEALRALPHGEEVLDLDWSPDSSALATASEDGGVRVWEVSTGRLVTEQSIGPRAVSVDWSPDGLSLAAGGYDGTKAWEIIRWTPLGPFHGRPVTYSVDKWISIVRWSPDGQMLAAGDWDGNVIVWDAGTGQQVLLAQGHVGRIDHLAWRPHSNLLASAGGDNMDVLWDSLLGHRLAFFSGHFRGTRALAWSPDGRVLVSGGADGEVKLWIEAP